MKSIPLYAGRTNVVVAHTVVDDADFARLGAHRWHLHARGYACRSEQPGGRTGKKVTRLLHRDVLQLTDNSIAVDHIDHDRLNNRRVNLRVATAAENNQNVPARGGSSRHRGVRWDKARGSWRAEAKLRGRTVFVGRFATEAAATEAASAFRSEHMPFAVEVTQ